MRVGVFVPTRMPFSAEVCIDYITKELRALGVEVVAFPESGSLPGDVDIYWDPRAMGGVPPYETLKHANRPVVVTVHGVAPFTVPAGEYYPNLRRLIMGKLSNFKRLRAWKDFEGRLAAIITVSDFAKQEIMQVLGLDGGKMYPVYHGVDHDIFKPAEAASDRKPYMLHVSQYMPKKNVGRIIEAYNSLSMENKPVLIAKLSGYPQRAEVGGVKVIREKMPHEELVGMFQGAMGFIFPSLHESFGIPIIEAMACGCPVITSNTTGCREVAGDAALLVDPRSVAEIAGAMERLITDASLRETLRQKGIERAKRFSWEKSAREHLEIFERVLKNG